jgi:hypothetical protein
MARLINGNGNRAIYAAQDADLIASLAGNVTCVANVGNKYAATEEDANTIGLADGVIITKEGRRIQLDAGETDLFTIPTGSSGVTNYYIIGYKLVQNDDSTQVAEKFVQKMSSSSETITENTFRGGATEVYVSLYRVTQVGFDITAIYGLLPAFLDNAAINSGKCDYHNFGSIGTLNANNINTNIFATLSNETDEIIRFSDGASVYSGLLYKYNSGTGFIIFSDHNSSNIYAFTAGSTPTLQKIGGKPTGVSLIPNTGVTVLYSTCVKNGNNVMLRIPFSISTVAYDGAILFTGAPKGEIKESSSWIRLPFSQVKEAIALTSCPDGK